LGLNAVFIRNYNSRYLHKSVRKNISALKAQLISNHETREPPGAAKPQSKQEQVSYLALLKLKD